VSRRRRGGRHEKETRSGKLLFSLTIIAVVALLVYSVWSAATSASLQGNSEPLGFEAAILDQLGATSPNSAFVKAVQDALASAAFTVKYYRAADVTVELYRQLPSLGFRLIVLRVHSGATYQGGVYPFTSEPYDEHRYTMEQLTGSLKKASVSGTEPYYFAISPTFVDTNMQGNFRGAIIVLSSCNGLVSTSLADPLIRRGASAVVSWDGPVTLDHTDKATEILLKALAERSTVSEAVQAAMDKVGPDPEYVSNLRYYPLESDHVTLWTITSVRLNERNQILCQIVQQKPVLRLHCSRTPAHL